MDSNSVIIKVGDKVTRNNTSIKGTVVKITGTGRSILYTVNWFIAGESDCFRRNLYLDQTENVEQHLSDEESEENRDEEDSSSSSSEESESEESENDGEEEKEEEAAGGALMEQEDAEADM
jgi:hypothetical protein